MAVVVFSLKPLWDSSWFCQSQLYHSQSLNTLASFGFQPLAIPARRGALAGPDLHWPNCPHFLGLHATFRVHSQ